MDEPKKRRGPKPGYGMPEGWRGTVLALYAQGASISKCAEAAGVNYHTIARWRDDNVEGFADDLAKAGEAFNDRMRDEIVERAFDRSFRGSDMWLERLVMWRLPEAKLARAEQEEARVDQLADALERFRQLVAARTVQPALEGGAADVAGEPVGAAEG